MPADAFFVNGDTAFINTTGADPKHPAAIVDPKSQNAAISVGDRATGQDPAQGVIASNGHSNLVFDHLIGRETAEVGPDGHVTGGIMDGYVFRVQGGSNVTLSNDEGYYGGKHIFGAIDTTGFLAMNDIAQGSIDGVAGNQLGYGNATALVSYADANQTGDTYRWIDCTVSNYSGSQPAFITHNDGDHSIKSILLQNLNALGSPIALMPGTNVTITYKGGSVQNNNLTAYTSPGTTEMIDGVKVSGVGSDIIVSGNAIVQNCLITNSGQDGGIQSNGPHNLIRFNTVAMEGYAGSAIHLGKDAKDNTLLGNLITGTRNAIKLDGDPASCSADYDFFDSSPGAPQFFVSGATQTLAQFQAAGKETHGATGNPMFLDDGLQSYSLRAGSPARKLVPASGTLTDLLGHSRAGAEKCDAGAYQTALSR
jgi:hypothetical protein